MSVSSTPALPREPELARYVTELADNERAGLELAARFDEARLNWRPGPDRWSVLECLEHLNLSARQYVPVLVPLIEKARLEGRTKPGPHRHPRILTWLIRQLEPPVKRKSPTRPNLTPASNLRATRVLADWREIHAVFRDAARKADGLDLAGLKFSSPILPIVRMSLGQGFHITTAHERRHLWQAEQVIAHPEFPGGTES
jgi:hypothetical protein